MYIWICHAYIKCLAALQKLPCHKKLVYSFLVTISSDDFSRNHPKCVLNAHFACVPRVSRFFHNFTTREYCYAESPLEWRHYWINSRRKVRNIVHRCNTFNGYIHDLIDDPIRPGVKTIHGIVWISFLRVIYFPVPLLCAWSKYFAFV